MDLRQLSGQLCIRGSTLVCLFCVLSFGFATAHARDASPSAPVEFRGYFKTADSLSFSLRIPERGQSFWIELGQWRNGVEIVEFDEEHYSLEVLINGEQFELPMVQANNRSLPVVTSHPQEILAENAPAVKRRPPRPTSVENTESQQDRAERKKRADRIRAQRAQAQFDEVTGAGGVDGTARANASRGVLRSSESSNQADNTLPAPLVLHKGGDQEHLVVQGAGVYRGHYTVRTPLRSP